MGTDPVRSALTTEYVQKLLKIKASQLGRRPEFRTIDPDDLEHDLTIHVLKQADNYDPARSAANTDSARVAPPATSRNRPLTTVSNHSGGASTNAAGSAITNWRTRGC